MCLRQGCSQCRAHVLKQQKPQEPTATSTQIKLSTLILLLNLLIFIFARVRLIDGNFLYDNGFVTIHLSHAQNQ